MAAECVGRVCDRSGWTERPTWSDLAGGARPPEHDEHPNLGEWAHGWQFWASNSLEKEACAELLRRLALPSRRVNAATPGKSRIYSAGGPFAAIWLLTCPTTDGLSITNELLQCCVRRRLGLAVTCNGPDPHGHALLASVAGGRTHGRHREVIAAWKQVLVEAGSLIPDRNIERLFLLLPPRPPFPHPSSSRRGRVSVPRAPCTVIGSRQTPPPPCK